MDSKKQSQIFKRIVKELKPHRVGIIFSLILAFINVLLTIQVPMLIGTVVDFIVGPGQVEPVGLYYFAISMAMAVAGIFVSGWAMNLINNRITYSVTKNLRDRAFEKLMHVGLKDVDSHPHGDYVSRIVADADTFSDGLLMGFTQAFTGVLTILGTIGLMFSISARIGAIVVVLTPLSLLLAKFISTKTFSYFGKQASLRGTQTAFVEEVINNESIVQMMDYTDDAIAKFDSMNEEFSEAAMKATFYSSTVNPSTRLINNVIYAIVGVIGAIFVVNGSMTVGGLTSFLSYASTYGKPFNEITGVITEFQNAIACAGRLFELIDSEPETDAGEIELTNTVGHIEFRHVYFSYDKEKPLIQDLNLDVMPGQKIAIVGPTGAGKSTIINLLMRFYDVDEGAILIDGTDIRDMRLADLRASFGMVLQETWLKEDTIKENLKFASENASDEEITTAAKASFADGFIKRMPLGYDTLFSNEKGLLSQGQMQLLCITRVMLNIPPMLILDEATSSIDTRTEQKIQAAFAKMMEGRTTFVVAHRLSTIKEADLILFVKDGQVVEQGSHTMLLQKGGFYAKLYQSQFRED